MPSLKDRLGAKRFDHWVKQTLRVRHYIRYVDDMVILGDSQIGRAHV